MKYLADFSGLNQCFHLADGRQVAHDKSHWVITRFSWLLLPGCALP